MEAEAESSDVFECAASHVLDGVLVARGAGETRRRRPCLGGPRWANLCDWGDVCGDGHGTAVERAALCEVGAALTVRPFRSGSHCEPIPHQSQRLGLRRLCGRSEAVPLLMFTCRL